MADSSTAITADNASSVVKSSYDDVNNALEGLLGNINTSGNSSNTPVWVPQPCPFANAPAGYILANGASFSASQYPQLGAAFPSGKVPDLRGLFIRGLDTTGTIDNVAGGRSVLTVEEGTLVANTGVSNNWWPIILDNVPPLTRGIDIPSLVTQQISWKTWEQLEMGSRDQRHLLMLQTPAGLMLTELPDRRTWRGTTYSGQRNHTALPPVRYGHQQIH